MFILPIDEGRPPRKFPLVNLSLIVLNVYFFLNTATQTSFERIVWQHGFTPAHPHLQDIFSSMFLHGGWAHLIGNMYFLYVFGNNVEDRLGKRNYLLTYFACGIGAALTQYFANPNSAVPMIGASGAISGVCALYMLMFPWNKMRLQFFFLIFPIFSIPARAFFVVGFWFLEQYFMARLVPVGSGGVAFWAHVGGFLTGIALFPFVFSKKTGRT